MYDLLKMASILRLSNIVNCMCFVILTRFVHFLKGDRFAPYLPMVMAPVLRTASIKPEISMLDPDEVEVNMCYCCFVIRLVIFPSDAYSFPFWLLGCGKS